MKLRIKSNKSFEFWNKHIAEISKNLIKIRTIQEIELQVFTKCIIYKKCILNIKYLNSLTHSDMFREFIRKEKLQL